MLINDMNRQASIDLLTRTRLVRLACAHERQPYITPIYCAYEDNYLYSFSTFGQKIYWMRTNPLVCVEADELVSAQDWATVVVLGKYEELPDTPQYEVQRKCAYNLLQKRPLWWEPGCEDCALGENAPNGGRVFSDSHRSDQWSSGRSRLSSFYEFEGLEALHQ